MCLKITNPTDQRILDEHETFDVHDFIPISNLQQIVVLGQFTKLKSTQSF